MIFGNSSATDRSCAAADSLRSRRSVACMAELLLIFEYAGRLDIDHNDMKRFQSREGLEAFFIS